MSENLDALRKTYHASAEALAICAQKYPPHDMPCEYYVLLSEFNSARCLLNRALDAERLKRPPVSQDKIEKNERVITSATYNRIQKRNNKMVLKMLDRRRNA